MSLRQLRNRVNALKRKLALPLVVIRLRPLAEEFCYEWAQARADFGRHKAPSKQMPQPFTSVETGPLSLIRRVAGHGFRLTTFMDLHRYLERCRAVDALPECHKIIRCLLPWSGNGVLQAILQLDAPATS